ncbi:MAG TPA: hypothetical protein VNM37_04420 [Candidatus Dormibacteraeota bacterium]|nr:hypothetical protein [Candidatus Dormibacteraeota bacterium]
MTVRSLAYWMAAPVAGLFVILFALPFIPFILLWGAWDACRLLSGPPRAKAEPS